MTLATSSGDPQRPAAEVPPAPAGFDRIYRDHVAFVWRVLRRLGVAPGDVEDVTHEVFMVVLRKLPAFEQRSSVRTWLYGIAYRAASEHRRRAHVRREIPGELPDLESTAPSQPEALDERRARERIDDILRRLDDDKRAVFVFFEIEGLSMQEVAEVVGCPLQTAYSRLHAARKSVEAAIQRYRAAGLRQEEAGR